MFESMKKRKLLKIYIYIYEFFPLFSFHFTLLRLFFLSQLCLSSTGLSVTFFCHCISGVQNQTKATFFLLC